MSNLLSNLAFIFVVVMVFNFIIFIHELGHFWAARWRGMQVDRFQIWFGKPLWKKTINGVQYGLGSIPFGGFVSLPQMAPMESIEGQTVAEGGAAPAEMPPITPLDKIIVALAGPVFSFLLAAACAVVVSKAGLLKLPPNAPEIGYVQPGSPAAEAGLQVGDVITQIAGETPKSFDGNFDAVVTMIALSGGEKIPMTVLRDGQEVSLESGYRIPEKKVALARKGMREIGIGPKEEIYVGSVMAHSPAALAGLQVGDQIVAINGTPIQSFAALADATKGAESTLNYSYMRDGATYSAQILPRTPDVPTDYGKKMIGITYLPAQKSDLYREHPTVGAQLAEAGTFMWRSIKAVANPKTSIGVEHMSGPIGMGTSMFNILRTEGGIVRLIWFLVMINVNLAIFNMLPFPVLDGGHIVMATGEWITGRQLPMKILEKVQAGFVMVIMSLFLYITLKDAVDLVTPRAKPQEVKFLPPQ